MCVYTYAIHPQKCVATLCAPLTSAKVLEQRRFPEHRHAYRHVYIHIYIYIRNTVGCTGCCHTNTRVCPQPCALAWGKPASTQDCEQQASWGSAGWPRARVREQHPESKNGSACDACASSLAAAEVANSKHINLAKPSQGRNAGR